MPPIILSAVLLIIFSNTFHIQLFTLNYKSLALVWSVMTIIIISRLFKIWAGNWVHRKVNQSWFLPLLVISSNRSSNFNKFRAIDHFARHFISDLSIFMREHDIQNILRWNKNSGGKIQTRASTFKLQT